MEKFQLHPGKLSNEQIFALLNNPTLITLNEKDWDAIKKSNQTVTDILKQNKTIYGINTGFGLLANTRIKSEELSLLQRRILLSHAAGTGELLPDEIVKLILLLKINSLARGYSGVRPILIEMLIQFYNEGIYPCIPSKGSVGASGDLAPLAHLSLLLIGEGSAHYQSKTISGKEALKIIKREPLELAAKEGLALINGTQVSTAIALHYLFQALNLFNAAIIIGALTVDAGAGSDAPFDARIHEVRGQIGQIKVAEMLRNLLAGSEIRNSHLECDRVQDPYCLRCQPQVMGACWDNLQHALNILTIEANAVSDNPLVFAEDGSICSGGNFHAEPVAQVADLIAIAVAEIGAISERRIALLVDPNFNGGLPAFLVPNPGLNSGFMIAHVTAASLASANKSLAHPASVDSLPTSANQEDHVSMATYAACRLGEIIDNVQTILAIELLAACQGIDLRKPLKTSRQLQTVIDLVRQHVSFWSEDRYFAADIEQAKNLILELREKINIFLTFLI